MKNDKRVIWKYRLDEGGETELTGWFTKVLAADEQDGCLVLWAENSLVKHDHCTGALVPRANKEKTTIHVLALGTGWDYDASEYHYLTTVQMSDGLVWHIFIKEEWIL